MPSLNQNKKYRTFINQRDRALEVLLRHCLKETSDISRSVFDHILNMIILRYRLIDDHSRFTNRARMVLDSIYHEIDHTMRILSSAIAARVSQMDKLVTTFAYAGEVEALSRLFGKSLRAVSPDVPDRRIEDQVYLALTKLQGKIRIEIEKGYVQKEDVDTLIARIKKVLPKVKRFKTPPKELKPLKEASADEWTKTASVDFIDESDWAQILSQYKTEYVPTNRNLSYDVEVGEPETEEWYGWEIEQNITDAFVNRVKDGMVQAATEAGVEDFLWVAVLDDRTRPEHRMKDGLTSTEIETNLEDKWADFDDQASVAPSGFNCRCRSVPYVADLPEAPPVDYGDFNEWLNDDSGRT